jgi:hypothetical protein
VVRPTPANRTWHRPELAGLHVLLCNLSQPRKGIAGCTGNLGLSLARRRLAQRKQASAARRWLAKVLRTNHGNDLEYCCKESGNFITGFAGSAGN